MMTRPDSHTPTFIVQSSPESMNEFYFAGRQKRSVAHGLLALLHAGVQLGSVDDETYTQNAITLTDAQHPRLIGSASEQILIHLIDQHHTPEAAFIKNSALSANRGVLDIDTARTKRDVDSAQDENVHILNYNGYGLTSDETGSHLQMHLAEVDELIGEVPPPGVIDLLSKTKLEEFGVDREALKVISLLNLTKAAFQYPITRSFPDQKADPLELEAIVYGKLDYHGKLRPYVTELPPLYFAS